MIPLYAFLTTQPLSTIYSSHIPASAELKIDEGSSIECIIVVKSTLRSYRFLHREFGLLWLRPCGMEM